MFHSFFPRPKLFFSSFLIWSGLMMALWYLGANEWGAYIGLAPVEGANEVADISFFWTPNMVWYYIYYCVCVAIFAVFWYIWSPHKWQNWSVLGSAFLIFTTAYSVQTSVALNNWSGPFFNLFNKAINEKNVPTAELYQGLLTFSQIAFMYMTVAVVTSFVTSHWLFRWRTAMNDFYASNWLRLHHIEGASQRVQEDTQRFAETMESLFLRAIDSVLTLIAFMPILVRLGENVKELPIIGVVPYPLVVAAIGWSAFGTGLLALAGIRLPGLYFKNQRVEAAYRKELVIGEDDESRAQPPTLRELFGNVRKNYFILYINYLYFNIARYLYLQADNVFSLFILLPSISAGLITLGLWQQISRAFGQVSNSFQYLVNSWGTIVELLSIHKRLHAFEAAMNNEELSAIDREWLDIHGKLTPDTGMQDGVEPIVSGS